MTLNETLKQLKALGRSLGLLILVVLAGCDLSTMRPEKASYNQPATGSFQMIERQFDADSVVKRVRGAQVSKVFFESTGATPLLGRLFVTEEFGKNSQSVMLVSHDLWQSRFGGSTSIVGRQVALDGTPTAVLGVMPRSFNLPDNAEFWIPISAK